MNEKNKDNGFEIINGEIVTAFVSDEGIRVGINAKCGVGVMLACVNQANKVPRLESAHEQLVEALTFTVKRLGEMYAFYGADAGDSEDQYWKAHALLTRLAKGE